MIAGARPRGRTHRTTVQSAGASGSDVLKGLVASIKRKKGWQLAEFAGDASPINLQHFIGRARWDTGAIRDDLSHYVAEHLGEPDGVLIVDETGFLKKGTKSE